MIEPTRLSLAPPAPPTSPPFAVEARPDHPARPQGRTTSARRPAESSCDSSDARRSTASAATSIREAIGDGYLCHPSRVLCAPRTFDGSRTFFERARRHA